MNKTLRFIAVAFLMMCGMAATAQTTLQKALLRYFEANGQGASMSEQMSPALVQATEAMQLKLASGYTTETFVKKYIDERFFPDLASVIAPSVEAEGLTVKDINALSEMLESEEGKTATINSAKMNSPEGLASMMEIVMKDAMSITKGETPEKVTTTATPARQKLFSAYFKSSGIGEMMPAIINAQFAQVDDATKAKFKQYFNDNIETLLLNAAEGKITDDDLRFYSKLCSQPQYDKMIKGVTNAVTDPQKLGMGLIMKYATWAQNQE